MCAAPNVPTLSSLTTEALRKCGYKTIGSSLLSRAQDEWMEEIKQEVWSAAKKLKSLQSQAVLVTVNGQARYSLPSDFSSPISVVIMDGTNIGTAQAGTTSSITLQSGSSYTDLVGKEILITAGTGAGSIGQVISYTDSTDIATVSPNFNTALASGSTYKIIDTYIPLTEKSVMEYDSLSYPMSRSTPGYFTLSGDSDDGEIILYNTPDKAYGLRARYYANLMELDLTSTLMSTLYQHWRNLWVKGVRAKALDDMDDNRAKSATQEYIGELRMLIMREQYGMDVSNLNMTVSNY